MTAPRLGISRFLSSALLCLLAACSRNGTTETIGNPTSPSTASAPKMASEACAPTVQDAWVRLVPGGDMPMDAGYATIDNACNTPAVITGATSPSYADVSVHESTMSNGMSQMRPVDALRIEPHARVELKPGSYHLMLTAPRARPKAGQQVTIVFQLQDGRSTAGTFEVRAMTP
jgi:hypothetical protein